MTEQPQLPLYLVVALQSEANPLIELFNLKSIQDGPFRYFERDNIRLMTSGMGKINTAAATAALLHGRTDRDQAVCVNIGIAGHASLALGSVFVAHRICDVASGRHWFPPLTSNPDCATSKLDTIEAPSGDYPDNTGLDMEASAFYPIATRYIAAELTQVVKIVSDTPEHALESLDKNRVTQLIADALPEVSHILAKLESLASLQVDASPVRKLAAAYGERWHLTVSQQNNLSRLFERHRALFGDYPALDLLSKISSAKEMLKRLETIVTAQGLRLP